MKIFQVGGAVRDKLLGIPSADVDHVVVGATAQQMLDLGYRTVGKDFPVFLHPQTHEEYALARTERKTAPGYHGFAFDAAPTVSLEDDLLRRDLTINAIAEDADGRLVDPHGGARDIEARLLRHVSPAFAEDPVRILRVARFLARFASRGFSIADETMALMCRMVEAGEVDHLVPERVWSETRKALSEATPSAFLQTLRRCGALRILFPEIDALYGVPQRAEYHPEVDTGVHNEMVLDMAARLAPGDDLIGFCAMTHDLGKALTPAEELPRHVQHEERGVAPLRTLAERLRVPVEYAELGVLCCRLHLLSHRAFELKPTTLLGVFEKLDALRKPKRVEQFTTVCEADKRGRLGLTELDYPQGDYLRAAFRAVLEIKAAPFIEAGLHGPAISEAMRKERVRVLARHKEEWKPPASGS